MLKIFQRKDNKLSKCIVENITKNYLPISGGTISGKLCIEKEDDSLNHNIYPLTLRSNGIDCKTVPSKNKYLSMRFTDKVNYELASMEYTQSSNGNTNLYLRAFNRVNSQILSSTLLLGVSSSGIVSASAPTPTSTKLYGTNIVTTKYLKDYSVKAIGGVETNIYVGGNNASDTIDLHTNRGFTQSTPFATFNAAWNFIVTYLRVVNVNIVVSGTVEMGGTYKTGTIGTIIKVLGADTDSTISLTNTVTTYQTNLQFHNVTIETNGYHFLINGLWSLNQLEFYNRIAINGTDKQYSFFHAVGNSYLYIDTTANQSFTLNGTIINESYATFIIEQGAALVFHGNTNFAGTVIGKRYICRHGSKIITQGKGNDFIPGSIDGTLDSSSSYS